MRQIAEERIADKHELRLRYKKTEKQGVRSSNRGGGGGGGETLLLERRIRVRAKGQPSSYCGTQRNDGTRGVRTRRGGGDVETLLLFKEGLGC